MPIFHGPFTRPSLSVPSISTESKLQVPQSSVRTLVRGNFIRWCHEPFSVSMTLLQFCINAPPPQPPCSGPSTSPPFHPRPLRLGPLIFYPPLRRFIQCVAESAQKLNSVATDAGTAILLRHESVTVIFFFPFQVLGGMQSGRDCLVQNCKCRSF